MSIFNNREIATFIWGLLFFFYALTKPEIRNSVFKVISAFLKLKILLPVVLMLVYVCTCIYILNILSLWENHQIKNAIYWFISVAFVSLFQLNKVSDNPYYLKQIVTDNFKIIVLIQFVITFYTFNLIGELFFVPLITFLVISQVITQSDKELQIVEKLINWLLTIFSVIIIVYTIEKLLKSFGEFANKKTLYDIVVPSLLSIMILPYLFLFALYSEYEQIFVRIRMKIKDIKLVKYAKFKILISFGFNIRALKRLSWPFFTENINKKNDIDLVIKELKKRLEIEKKPPEIDPSEGWCPFKSKNVLLDEGLKTGYYYLASNNEWYANSNMLDVSEGIIPNNIFYSVCGNAFAAKKLELMLTVFDLENLKGSLIRFLKIANKLCQFAIGCELNEKMIDALKSEYDYQQIINGKQIEIKERMLTENAFEIKLEIQSIG